MKRGYKEIRGFPVTSEDQLTAHRNNAKPKTLPNDPLYPKEWYIVSGRIKSCTQLTCLSKRHYPTLFSASRLEL